MVRSKTETCVRDGVAYLVETTWDDENGNSEIREFAPDGSSCAGVIGVSGLSLSGGQIRSAKRFGSMLRERS